MTWQLWHFGEYNYERVARRGDPITIGLCKSQFADHVMRVCFCLNDDFAPYWKWTATCFRQIPWAGPIADELDAFHATDSVEEGKAHVEAICRAIRERLVTAGFLRECETDGWGHKVMDEEIRRLEEGGSPES
jgi:hypothetical protein